MKQGTITLTTSSSTQFIDITHQTEQAIGETAASEGVVHLFNPHTTAGLTINEGADPAVRVDILAALRQITPNLTYQHLEGNSPAHLMASLIGSSVTVFVTDRTLLLGTWQKIFFCEFDGPRSRTIHWRLMTTAP